MADYYTKYSVVIPMSAERSAYAKSVYDASGDAVFSGSKEGMPEALADDEDYIDGFCFECVVQSDGIWINGWEGGLESAIKFIQHLLEHFNDDGTVVFEWACDCSKPRVDAYGGGAVRITRHEIETVSTGEIARRWAQQPAAFA